jgi:hypothetical protein
MDVPLASLVHDAVELLAFPSIIVFWWWCVSLFFDSRLPSIQHPTQLLPSCPNSPLLACFTRPRMENRWNCGRAVVWLGLNSQRVGGQDASRFQGKLHLSF